MSHTACLHRDTWSTVRSANTPRPPIEDPQPKPPVEDPRPEPPPKIEPPAPERPPEIDPPPRTPPKIDPPPGKPEIRDPPPEQNSQACRVLSDRCLWRHVLTDSRLDHSPIDTSPQWPAIDQFSIAEPSSRAS
ncbi:hypothetical protein [Nannocystis radixulma]|uniref:Uncharacterized protein n=1 Tax=Nannocystis radixulma TaxID=2995305 RepID=A0ABT5BEH2_9BACT|nr:hypothetical protein [Nannocystis radixulma]MDC0672559.1 hypothetical protein [Nannocystis radixulma]